MFNRLFLCLVGFVVALGICPASQAEDQASACGAVGTSLPEDVIIRAERDGSMSIEAIGEWSFFVEKDGKWENTPQVNVTCTCQDKMGGCNPTYHQGSVGCMMTECGSCVRGGAFVPFNTRYQGVTFATDQEIRELPSFTPKFFDVPQVAKEMAQFLKENGGLQSENTADIEVRHVPVNVYGYIASITVPATAREASLPIARVNVRCSCNSGGGCTHGSRFGYHWCDASNCQSCTLTAE